MSIARIIKKTIRRYYFSSLDYQPEQLSPAQIDTVVIYQPDAVGDAMSLFPVLRSLERSSIKRIVLVLSPRSVDVFKHFQPANMAVDIHVAPHRFELTNKRIKQIARQLRQRYGRPDLCIEGTRRNKTATAIFVGHLRARCNLGVNGSTMRCYSRLNQRAQAFSDENTALPLVWTRLMEDFGFPTPASRNFEFLVTQETEQEMGTALSGVDRYAVLNLDGSDERRRFSTKKGLQIAEALHDSTGLPIFIVFGPGGETKANQIASRLDYVHTLHQPPSLQRTAGLVKHASLVVTPDTSVLHMASAFNIPVIAIYEIYRPHWRPLSDKYSIIDMKGPIEAMEIEQLRRELDNRFV
ncbi:glycosyltransferase family 9 protein [Carnimonas bestiolae]|uniref:glycosyltransferase family 9 protein n=1 Tax=Carnimonas bestiolae TaxID=3402172 RepID=UPI003EDBB0B9